MKTKLISLIAASFLYGQELNFEEALHKTITNNKELKAKKLTIQTSKIDHKNAKGYELGNLTFKENIANSNSAMNVFGMKLSSREATFGDFGFTNMGTITPATAPNDLNNPKSRTNFETKLTYELPIFTGFKLQNAKEMAALQIKANEAKYTFDEKQLQLEVLKAYNGAVAAKYFIDAIGTIKESSSFFVYMATEMHKEGYTTELDIDQAAVFDSKINAMALDAKNQYALALAYLKFLCDDEKIEGVKDFKTFLAPTQDLVSLQSYAIEKRDDIKWMEHNTKTMARKVDFEKSGNYPMIGSFFEYGFNDNRLDNLRESKDYYTLALGLEYKIFDGFTTSSHVEKAKIEHAKAEHYLGYMKDGIKLGVKKATLTIKTKSALLEEKIKRQNLADKIMAKSKEMYQNQLISMSDMLVQSAHQQQAITDVIIAKYELSIATAELELAIGNELKE